MQEHRWMKTQFYIRMKIKTIRILLFISMLVACMFAMLSGIGLLTGIIKPLWLACLLGVNLLVAFFSAMLIYVIGTDKDWWATKEQLEEQIETYKRKCAAYQRATEDLIQVQLKYHYDNIKDEYDETLKNLAD